MTIFTLSTIRTSGKLLRQFQIVGFCFFIAGCQTGTDVEQAAVSVATTKSTLETTINDSFPGFTPWRDDQNEAISRAEKLPGYAKGDFNGDSLMDEALLLSKPNEWKLVVFFQESAGDYSVEEITTFPGKDSEWKAIPTQKIRLYPVAAAELAADRLGLDVAGSTAKLEYSWQEKTQSFTASRIRDSAPIQNQQENDSVDGSITTLFAQDPKSEQDLPSYLDIDNQSTDDKSGADLLFTSGAGSMRFYTLNPLNNAKAMPFGKSKPNYDDCSTQQNVMSAGSLPEIELGMHFCIKTDQDNIAHVWIQDLDFDVHSITLGYQAWVSNH